MKLKLGVSLYTQLQCQATEPQLVNKHRDIEYYNKNMTIPNLTGAQQKKLNEKTEAQQGGNTSSIFCAFCLDMVF